MWLILSASPPTFALILAAPSCAVVPSNIFILAPVKDESLQATPTMTIKQSALSGARSFLIKIELSMRSCRPFFDRCVWEREYIARTGEAEARERCVRPIFLAANGRDDLAPLETFHGFHCLDAIAGLGTVLADWGGDVSDNFSRSCGVRRQSEAATAFWIVLSGRFDRRSRAGLPTRRDCHRTPNRRGIL